MATRGIVDAEFRLRAPGGGWRWTNVRAAPVLDAAGRIQKWAGINIDIDARKVAEEALQTSEARFRAIVETATDYAIFTTDPDGRIETWPPGAAEIFGWSAEEAIGQPAAMTYTPEDRAAGVPERERQEAREKGQAPNVRWHLRKDGSRVFIDGVMRPLRGEDGTVTRFVKVGQDVTERQAMEEALRASEEFSRRMLASSADCIKVLGLDARIQSMSEGGMRVMEVDDPAQVEGRFWPDLWPGEGRALALAAVEEAGRGGTGRFQHEAPTLKSTPRWWDVIVTPILGGDGRPERLLSISRDVTTTKRAEARLRELNETLEARVAAATAERDRVWRNSRDLLVVVGSDGVFRAVSPAWSAILGHDPAEVEGRPFLDFVWPEDAALTQGGLDEAADARDLTSFENRYRHKDGGFRWLSWHTSVEGDLVYAYGRDITAERERQAELEAAQEQLRQSQKMEAMGQLTGGVAHDFNNLLTPIIGSLDRLLSRGVGSPRERQLMDGALQSAERAKTLVQRLLAFARRQPLQPTAIDLRELVGGMADLITSTTGPRVDVQVDLPKNLPPALADANQLEMALLNLAVNARDAMPEGGTLIISAERESVKTGRRTKLRSGHYVRLSVQDTGIGMDEATLARAVEPFFSTKGIGKGTGLGLSMVHGLASQLGGGLTITSHPGQGTTVSLWLPISSVAPQEGERDGRATAAPKAQGIALLVDDEDLVRMSTADMLIDLGYEVIEATSAEEALRQVREGLRPDLVITDHLMPGMSGLELARVLRSRRPELPVLIVSGYAEMDGISPGFPRLTKPFRVAELASSLAVLVPKNKQ